MKKVKLSVATLSFFLLLSGCTSDNGKVKELEKKVEQLEKENKELKSQGSDWSITVDSKESKDGKSNLGARSNPVPVGEELTFNPLYVNQEVEIKAKVTDVKRGSEAEEEVNQYGKIHLNTAKSNIGGLKENTEFLTYTITINPKGVNKDEGIRLPGLSKSFTIDGDDLGYSHAIDKLDGFSNDGNVYVDKEYTFRMYGQIEKGKEGLVGLTDLNSKIFFKVK